MSPEYVLLLYKQLMLNNFTRKNYVSPTCLDKLTISLLLYINEVVQHDCHLQRCCKLKTLPDILPEVILKYVRIF